MMACLVVALCLLSTAPEAIIDCQNWQSADRMFMVVTPLLSSAHDLVLWHDSDAPGDGKEGLPTPSSHDPGYQPTFPCAETVARVSLVIGAVKTSLVQHDLDKFHTISDQHGISRDS